MSIDFHEEKDLGSSSSSVNQYDFDDELYKVFMTHLTQILGITDREELSGGLSGAHTSSVRIDGSGQVKMGQYILKVCLSEKAEREIQKHGEARASSILRGYVPELITSKSHPELPLTGILYQVAGGGHLMRTTLQKSLELHHFPLKSTEELVRVILEWNFETLKISETRDLLGSIEEDLGEKHLSDLIEGLNGIVDYPNRQHLVLIKLGVTKYNPVHFLLNQEVYPSLQKISNFIRQGKLHRDLHPGNVIVPADSTADDLFQVIDFAASGSGNVFFDLAYLELSILLNSFSGGFRSVAELRRWWELEMYLLLNPLPELEQFPSDTEALRRVLPIRRALVRRMTQDNFRDDYWVSFLTASVEAGLDLARKIRRRSIQRVAFLTAVSRFNYLIEQVLQFSEILSQKREESLASMYWPGEEPPLPLQEEEKRISTWISIQSSGIQEVKVKIEFVWPGEITKRSALYDPWNVINGIWSTLTGEVNQGVLLVGERKFGKSSFLNCMNGLFPTRKGNIRAMRLDTLGIRHSAQSFAREVLSKMSQSVRLEHSPLPYNSSNEEFDSSTFFEACHSIVNKKKGIRFVICIDEIDSTLNSAYSEEDAQGILQILSKLLTHPDFPIPTPAHR